ncbi:NADH-quinone oxidoreductase subunit NuoE family protein [Methanospirillum lacunae]|uniref:NAD(P)H-dependent oxidoreductase subunit E n=1 Tax=Methanospirillum lacunae TaxID=668570 RepID=A0A2V2N623_9EURY|nr:NAD(P)H-dependent oxidoreductase subunit E [Methanospirillum lacunae]PWR71677.1 NAD(P)H-dependent oxidoreductase subunit E [Methanospirillum lacunae]
MNDTTFHEIISRYHSPSGRTLGILRDIQIQEGYIPRELLNRVSVELNEPVSRLYSLVTFYSFFSLHPVGEHMITVCMGTPCHVRGAEKILETLQSLLQLSGESKDGKYSQTTQDNMFTVEIARCFGACSMAPVLHVDGDLYGYVTPEKIPDILSRYGWKGTGISQSENRSDAR